MNYMLLCFILGWALFPISTKKNHDHGVRAPASISQEGNYQLVSGTTGCPGSLIWIEQCAGFVLNPRNGSEELETEKFCHINQSAQIATDRGAKLTTSVQRNERYIHKTAQYIDINGVRSATEDTLIFDKEKDQFLWEHSKDHVGFSCLYSK